MYPNEFINLFPPFPKNNKVFVAMSFDKRFTHRWENVIYPGICKIKVDGQALQPYRVDLGQIGDSIQTEILKEIASCRLVFGDVTSLGKIDETIIRNGNVLYEIGIAHACRMPEEVVLFRSDADQLLFDVTNIRVHSYNPDDPEQAINAIAAVVFNSLKEIDLKKGFAVTSVSSKLDFQSFSVLGDAISGPVLHPIATTVMSSLEGSARISAINKLLELGVLEAKYANIGIENILENQSMPSNEIMSYVVTPFGRAVLSNCMKCFGFDENKIKILRSML